MGEKRKWNKARQKEGGGKKDQVNVGSSLPLTFTSPHCVSPFTTTPRSHSPFPLSPLTNPSPHDPIIPCRF
ncbi:hypothetical protein E2C01_077595 [Portunus trituberculatus]|uniref:Uncharacterized protein n=1 Tax=Portunus trituberculatus TaxID=210409 RepID=A0A5B7IMR1_PORTR|nr:hypothetical protein [Portunus trituberculatus]